MGRFYTASFETSSTSTAKTLMFFEVPADLVMRIISAEVVAPDDDTNEQLHCTFQTITTLGTPTDTAVTPAKHDNGDAVATVAVSADVTALEPTYTANTEIGNAGFPSLAGWQFRPASDERPVYSPSTDVGLRLLTAPGTAKTLTVRVTFEEIGG